MDLILWRHAEAWDGYPDMERALTSRGLKQAEKMAAFLRQRLPKDVRMLVSPARRTQQTALALDQPYDTIDAIAPGAPPEALLTAAGWPDSKGCVLLVGHQPSLGEVAAAIMTGASADWSIKKGAIWWFRSEPDGSHRLRLAISPDLL